MKKPTSQTKSKGQKRRQQTSFCDQSTDEESVVSVHLNDDTDDSLHIGDDELTEPLALGPLVLATMCWWSLKARTVHCTTLDSLKKR
ncbi:hypothetical protein QYM36_017477 [Artemia franciscana]|uniref:Uncharacterized protein n=1 Tax=Artemia franciscana TaxID=6661 RepID=A0AA88HBZ0_ARTSF|nr:hypothetical protein QYM36_017477 [Artemia franciscana]